MAPPSPPLPTSLKRKTRVERGYIQGLLSRVESESNLPLRVKGAGFRQLRCKGFWELRDKVQRDGFQEFHHNMMSFGRERTMMGFETKRRCREYGFQWEGFLRQRLE